MWVAQEWLHALQEKSLKFSSLSNYVNSLIAITSHVYATYSIDESIHSMARSPHDDLVRLRGQCESMAKEQRLFARRDKNWIEWPAAQQARQRAEQLYRAKKTPQLQRDWLIISLHTVLPPECAAFRVPSPQPQPKPQPKPQPSRPNARECWLRTVVSG